MQKGNAAIKSFFSRLERFGEKCAREIDKKVGQADFSRKAISLYSVYSRGIIELSQKAVKEIEKLENEETKHAKH